MTKRPRKTNSDTTGCPRWTTACPTPGSIFSMPCTTTRSRGFSPGAEPGLLGVQCRQKPRSHGQPGLDGQRQPLRQRNRFLLERPGHGPRQDQDGSLHAAGVRPPWKRKAASPTAAAGCSGATRAPNPWATAGPTATSSWNSAANSKNYTPRAAPSPSPLQT